MVACMCEAGLLLGGVTSDVMEKKTHNDQLMIMSSFCLKCRSKQLPLWIGGILTYTSDTINGPTFFN